LDYPKMLIDSLTKGSNYGNSCHKSDPEPKYLGFGVVRKR
jgi:hypothetical protein